MFKLFVGFINKWKDNYGYKIKVSGVSLYGLITKINLCKYDAMFWLFVESVLVNMQIDWLYTNQTQFDTSHYH